MIDHALRNTVPGDSILRNIFEHQIKYATIHVVSLQKTIRTVDKYHKMLEFVDIGSEIITIGVNFCTINSKAMSHALDLLSRIDDIEYNQYVEFGAQTHYESNSFSETEKLGS